MKATHVKKSAQNFFRSSRIEHGFETLAAHTSFAQPRLRAAGGEAFVDQLGANAITSVQALREAPCESAHFVFRSVRVARHADHQQHGMPFRNDVGDCGETTAVVFGGNDGERMRSVQLEVADCHADAFFAEVEGEDGAASRVRREG